jgi:hypothetical protein
VQPFKIFNILISCLLLSSYGNFIDQKTAELRLNLSKLWLVGTLGIQEGPAGTPRKGDFLSERHFLSWAVTDEIKLRDLFRCRVTSPRFKR